MSSRDALCGVIVRLCGERRADWRLQRCIRRCRQTCQPRAHQALTSTLLRSSLHRSLARLLSESVHPVSLHADLYASVAVLPHFALLHLAVIDLEARSSAVSNEG